MLVNSGYHKTGVNAKPPAILCREIDIGDGICAALIEKRFIMNLGIPDCIEVVEKSTGPSNLGTTLVKFNTSFSK